MGTFVLSGSDGIFLRGEGQCHICPWTLKGLVLPCQVMCVSFLLWVQLTMFITIGAHYDDKWVWTPGETQSANWDSFARAFLMAWMTTLIAVGVMVSWKERAKTFFMMPCPLSEASHVSITKEDTDESGNLVTSHYLCRQEFPCSIET